MNNWLLVLFGFLSGIIGGMGMGGGTLLVPLLSFLDMSQKTVQAINLISFLPMCIVALCFHSKNHLVQKQHVGWIIVPAVLSAIAGALLTQHTENKVLKICFGVFLVAVGIWQLVLSIKAMVQSKNKGSCPTKQ
ncbi:MAG: sulfite exporter TauE/SafE family protein [Clostridia bacterium]|nr:sulfite exporter TauE/SafE family protein [Clostridia bacterium]